jgi:hypothetical protein
MRLKMKNKILSYQQFITEDLDKLWKTGVSKTDEEIAGKIKIFISKLEQTDDVKKSLEGFADFTADIITESQKKITEEIPSEDIEDSEKIKKIGQQLFSILSAFQIFLSKLSTKFEDIYNPKNIFIDAKSPLKDIFNYDGDGFEKNIEKNIIKLLNVWGKESGLSDEGLNKIKNIRLFESDEDINVPVKIIGEKASNMMNYMRDFSIDKIKKIKPN